jgi:hypothetical protein
MMAFVHRLLGWCQCGTLDGFSSASPRTKRCADYRVTKTSITTQDQPGAHPKPESTFAAADPRQMPAPGKNIAASLTKVVARLGKAYGQEIGGKPDNSRERQLNEMQELLLVV